MLPIVLLCFMGLTTTVAIVPGMLTNAYAARLNGGAFINCAAKSSGGGQPPAVCSSGSSDAALYQGYASWAAAAVAVFLCPTIGAISDSIGRRFFFGVAAGFSALQSIGVLLFQHNVIGPDVYIVLAGLSQAVNVVGAANAYTVDTVQPVVRTAALGLILGCFSIAFIVGPILSAFLPVAALGYVGACCSVLAFIGFMILPESLEQERRKPFTLRTCNPFSNVAVLLRSRLFVCLSVVVVIQTMCFDGFRDLLLFYVEEFYTLGRIGVSMMLFAVGVSAAVVQVGLITPLKGCLGNKGLLVLGLVCTTVANLLFLVHGVVLLFVQLSTVRALGYVVFPAIAATKADNADPDEQGLIQGALIGIKTLGGGTGPAVFAAAYKAFGSGHVRAGLPYYPAAPWVLGAALIGLAIPFGLCLPRGRAAEAIASAKLPS